MSPAQQEIHRLLNEGEISEAEAIALLEGEE